AAAAARAADAPVDPDCLRARGGAGRPGREALPDRGGDPRRLGLGEVVPGLHRATRAAADCAGRRAGRARSPAPGARLGLRRNGCCRRLRDRRRRLRGGLGGPARPPAKRAPGERPLGVAAGGMKVLVVSGMWPPDVGGPASHAPEVCEFLRSRGHTVEAATMASRAPAAEAYPVHWASRRLPLVVRHAAAVRMLRRAARRADVVYTTGIIGRTSLAAALA